MSYDEHDFGHTQHWSSDMTSDIMPEKYRVCRERVTHAFIEAAPTVGVCACCQDRTFVITDGIDTKMCANCLVQMFCTPDDDSMSGGSALADVEHLRDFGITAQEAAEQVRDTVEASRDWIEMWLIASQPIIDDIDAKAPANSDYEMPFLYRVYLLLLVVLAALALVVMVA